MARMDAIGTLQTLMGSQGTSSVKAATDATSLRAHPGANGAAGNSILSGTDQASVSPAGDLMAQGLGGSDVRLAKVAALQQAIASGNYRVSAGDVADKMVEGMLNGR